MDDDKRSSFTKVANVKAVRIPASHTNTLLRANNSSKFIWTKSGCKSVYPCPVSPKTHRIVLLSDALPVDLMDCSSATLTSYDVVETYADLSAEEVLRELLPGCADPPTSFETIGHIAHMNLREEFRSSRNLIGSVILDKNPHIDLVVTKVGELSGDFRTFDMEVIASRKEPISFIARVSENKMRLTIDYQRCYWNSRLSSERSRLLKSFMAEVGTDLSQGRLLDMCCGVGALSCFSAREGLEVFANDLNPFAIECVKKNIADNHLESFPISASNMDAREFIRKIDFTQPKTNLVMINLPEIGIEFLDVFRGLFDQRKDLGENTFKIYCHCFSREKPAEVDVRRRIKKALSLTQEEEDIDLSLVHVRDVAPNKIMYSAEFRLPESVLVANKRSKSVLV